MDGKVFHTALDMLSRTPEQDCAYFEAMHMADEARSRYRQDISDDVFQRMYLSVLQKHMLEAIRPLLKAKADYEAFYPSPTLVVGFDGFWKFMQRAPTDAETLIDQMIERIKERYLKGLT